MPGLGLSRGRPARKLRLANETAQVLGFVIDADRCRVVSAGLDGRLHGEEAGEFPTPATYDALIEAAAREAGRLMGRSGLSTLGLGISLPGLIDCREKRGILSPNVPITNRQSPCRDLSERLGGLACVTVQEADGLCLAERYYGEARGLDDFAMVDVGAGVGLGVMSGGRLLTGRCGLAGEIGHVTVELDGRPCGCGNRGCLETVASDAALAWAASQRAGRKVTIDEVVEHIRRGESWAAEEFDKTCRYLAIGLAAVINLFNPSTLFVHGRLLAADDAAFPRLIEETRRHALAPSFADCRIVRARGSKRQGAVAAIIEHLTDSVAPSLSAAGRAA